MSFCRNSIACSISLSLVFQRSLSSWTPSWRTTSAACSPVPLVPTKDVHRPPVAARGLWDVPVVEGIRPAGIARVIGPPGAVDLDALVGDQALPPGPVDLHG
jgi:hypothetical protein